MPRRRALATDVYRPDGAGPFPVLLERTPYDKAAQSRSEAHRRRPGAAIARRGRRLFRPRTAMPSSIRTAAAAIASGGEFTKYLSEAEDGYDTLAWLDAPALVQRPDRHLRPVLCRAHAGGARLPRPAGTGGAVPRLRRLLQRLSQRHPPWRRVRPEAGDLGLSQRRSADAPRPRREGGASRRRTSRAWFRRMPWTQRALAGQRRARIRGLPVRAMVARRLRRLLEAARASMPRAFTTATPTVPVVHLSGWYDPYARTAIENYVGLSRRRARAGSG